MNKEKRLFRVIVGIGILIIAMVFINIERKKSNSENTIERWPNFTTTDIYGQIINGKDYNKRIRYVQFLGAMDNNNLMLLENVYRIWADKIDIFVFVKNERIFRERVSPDFSKAIVINDEFIKMSSLFKSSEYGNHYLFEEKGNVVFFAENSISYDFGVVRALQQVVNRRNFRIADIIRENDHLEDYPEFTQAKNELNDMQGEYLIVGLIYLFCDSCASGPLVVNFQRFHSLSNGKTSFLLILSREHYESELDAFKSQLSVDFPVVIADQKLNKRWEDLMKIFSRNAITNIVFAVNHSGKIVKVLDPSCQTCQKPFWIWVQKHSLKQGGY